jgi:DNA-binding beta-propeller fold protein YncE
MRRYNVALYTLNQSTGAATLVGAHGVADLFGLAYDSQNNTLYGDDSFGNFYSIDATTGAATLIGSNSVYPGGLAYDAGSNTLYLTSAGSGELYSLDVNNGATTLVSSGVGDLNDNGITWDPLLGTFWVDDWNGNAYRYLGFQLADTGNCVPFLIRRSTISQSGQSSWLSRAFCGESSR